MKLTVRSNKLIDAEELEKKKDALYRELQNHFLAAQYQSHVDDENKTLVENIKEVAKATVGQNSKTFESRYLQETLKLMDKWQKMKLGSNVKNLEYAELNKMSRKYQKEDI